MAVSLNKCFTGLLAYIQLDAISIKGSTKSEPESVVSFYFLSGAMWVRGSSLKDDIVLENVERILTEFNKAPG